DKEYKQLGIIDPENIGFGFARCIYFIKLGGLVSPEKMRKIFMLDNIDFYSGRSEHTIEPYRYLRELKDEAISRFVEDTEEEKGFTKEEKELFWASIVIPVGIQALLDKLEADEVIAKEGSSWIEGINYKDGYDYFFDEVTEPQKWWKVWRGIIEEELLDKLGLAGKRIKGIAYSRLGEQRKNKEGNQYYITYNKILPLFKHIYSSNLDFKALLSLIEEYLPKSIFRNFALYILFIKTLKERFDLVIEDKKIFDFEYMQEILRELSKKEQEEVSEIIKKITPLLIKDINMEKINKYLIGKEIYGFSPYFHVAWEEVDDFSEEAEGVINKYKASKRGAIQYVRQAKMLSISTDLTREELDELLKKKELLPYKETLERLYEESHPLEKRYMREKDKYLDMFYFDIGGYISQLDIFIPMLNKEYLVDFICGEGDFKHKLDEILTYFPRKSASRDYFLKLLLDTSSITVNEINLVLPHLFNQYFKEQYALKALEMEKETYPERFTTLEDELERILHYFPQLSYIRDDILLELINQKVTNPENLKKVNHYLLRHPDNIRHKEQAQFIWGGDIFKEWLKEKSPNDKKDFLLWLFEIKEEKPWYLAQFEYTYKVNLDSLKSIYAIGSGKYYKNLGSNLRKDFFSIFLYGEKGIFSDNNVFEEFIDEIASAVSDGQRDNVFKVMLDGVFKNVDDYRKEKILLSLLETLSQLKSQGEQNEERKEALAIRGLLESLGIIGIKLGQFLTTFGFIPELLREELQELKDKAEPLPKEIAFTIIEKIYGGFGKKFLELGKLLGSASIKVVYSAKLKDGRNIVVKIKRPEIEKTIKEDMAFLKKFLEDTRFSLQEKDIFIPQDAVERIGEMIIEELDFRQEAENAK
ncbi:MAG: hypothetical protein DRP72_04550, partial [Candidatus Omnitrophota bacterium]